MFSMYIDMNNDMKLCVTGVCACRQVLPVKGCWKLLLIKIVPVPVTWPILLTLLWVELLIDHELTERKRREGEMEALDQGCPNFFKGGQFRSHQNTRGIYFMQYYDLIVFDTVKTLLFILIRNLWHTIAVFCFLSGRFGISGNVKGIQICTIQPLHQPLYWFSSGWQFLITLSSHSHCTGPLGVTMDN